MILATARADLSNSLWQAALGVDRGAATAAGAQGGRNVQGMSLDSLLAMLTSQADEAARPRELAKAAERADAAPAPAEGLPGGEVSRDGLGANVDLARHLTAAAERTGIPSAVLASIVDAEAAKDADGRWRIFSRNPRSSAAGLGQFLSGSWETLAERPGTWLNQLAEANGWLNEHGHVRGRSRSALLELRYDPQAAINGIADYARDNLDRLRAAGVAVDGNAETTARAAYLGHHLGLGDAIRFLKDGIASGRARHLLDAQIGHEAANRKIAAYGDASAAHRAWLLGYIDRNVRPERFAMMVNPVSARSA
nr:peptidoglycan-binding protein [Sphingomonas quercus]